jgi:acyl-coenzyme A thioesterase PaaI-like protein
MLITSLEGVAMSSGVACTLEELAHVLAHTAFLKPYGFLARACAVGECTVLAPYDPSLGRPGGIISGLTLMGVADVAMWLAIMTRRGTHEQWVTTDMKTAFLRSARKTDISCVARILKLGKRTAYGTAECHDADGHLLAHHVLSYSLVPGDESKAASGSAASV